MSNSRRMFLKNVGIAGISAACGSVVEPGVGADVNETGTGALGRCPYFDQPMMCDGPDEQGRYRCDD